MNRVVITFCCMLLCSACQQLTQNSGTHAGDINIIPIADDAFSGSSINVLSGVKQTLFSRNGFQYAAFYNADARLVLAKRALNNTQWQVVETPFSGNVHDAHNHISLIVDAQDYLHIAWDHHNTPLNYARSNAPGSLQVKRVRMLSQPGEEAKVQENSVTYPQFYPLANGDLLFAYRNGGSGRGNLVLNRFDTTSQQWLRLHHSLLDGEGQRSAYWDMTVDSNGVIHLAWIWRETPDVATNHDLAYAQSTDNGASWHTLSGSTYQLPILASTSDVVKAVPQHHKLMNPPVITADQQSRPFIASYWADTPTDKPRYHVVFPVADDASQTWREIKAPKVAENFGLSGHGTKRPPISRAVLLVDEQKPTPQLHLIYRDDFQQSQVIAQSTPLETVNWHTNVLVNQPMGAWEPSIDIGQWHTHQQAHLLLQAIGQDDGNDRQSLQTPPSTISVLTWQR